VACRTPTPITGVIIRKILGRGHALIDGNSPTTAERLGWSPAARSTTSHQLNNAGCRVAVTDKARRPRITEIAGSLPKLAILILTNGAHADTRDFNEWRDAAPYSGPLPEARDICCVMYTSGTTGPAKGVLMPHAHCFLMGLGIIDNVCVGSNDRYYIVLPLFHANGLFLQLGATLIAGARAVLRERFSASEWLSDIRRFEVTVTNMLGVVAAFVSRLHRTQTTGTTASALSAMYPIKSSTIACSASGSASLRSSEPTA
jgi:acyl-CoA synthetase (AMP-forming)/AMP-acid ligase II